MLEDALRAELERRQARVAELIAERCAPHPVPCLFPAITIEVVGDTRIVCLDLTNRRARRQLRFAACAHEQPQRPLDPELWLVFAWAWEIADLHHHRAA